MNRHTTALSSARTSYLIALGLGLFLGATVAAMAQRNQGAGAGFFAAAVFVLASSASFVFFVLGPQRPVPSVVRSRQIHTLAGVIGVGLLLSIQLIELLNQI